MKDILTALKSEIDSALTTLMGVHVLADEDMLPTAVRFPCVGLKDGDSEFSEGGNKTEWEKGSVLIFIYVQLMQNEEASIMGVDNTAPVADVKGLLDLMADLRTELNYNTLSGIIQHGFIGDVMGSQTMFAKENVFVQRKGCRFRYER